MVPWLGAVYGGGVAWERDQGGRMGARARAPSGGGGDRPPGSAGGPAAKCGTYRAATVHGPRAGRGRTPATLARRARLGLAHGAPSVRGAVPPGWSMAGADSSAG